VSVPEHNYTGESASAGASATPPSSMGDASSCHALLLCKDSILNCACVSFKQKQNILGN
jgi:hypothetical protein